MKKIRGDVICVDCGTIGLSKTELSGSFWAELLLYIVGFGLAPATLFISVFVPIGYSFHRRSSATKVCKECGGKVVGVATPRGEKLLREFGFVEV